MNRVDRSEAFTRSGRSLVSDPRLSEPPVSPPPPVDISDDDFVPKGLRAWAGRSSNGIHVQGLIDADGATYITVVVGGQCQTREIARERAAEVFEHPFANEDDGFTLPLR